MIVYIVAQPHCKVSLLDMQQYIQISHMKHDSHGASWDSTRALPIRCALCVTHKHLSCVCYAHQILKYSVGSTASRSTCFRLCWQTFVKCSGTCSSLSSASLMPLSCRARQWSDLLVNTCLHSPCSPLPINTLRNNCFQALHQFIASSSSITSRNAQTFANASSGRASLQGVMSIRKPVHS